MEGIQFDESRFVSQAPVSSSPSGIIGMVIKTGLAKDERSASKYLLFAAAVMVLASVILFVMAIGGDGEHPYLDPSQDKTLSE